MNLDVVDYCSGRREYHVCSWNQQIDVGLEQRTSLMCAQRALVETPEVVLLIVVFSASDQEPKLVKQAWGSWGSIELCADCLANQLQAEAPASFRHAAVRCNSDKGRDQEST